MDGKRWLGRQLFTHAHVGARFVEERESQTFNPDAVESYLQKVRRWKEELLVLVHILAGYRRERPNWLASNRLTVRTHDVTVAS